MTNSNSTTASTTRIIKQSTCPSISPSAKGKLTYNISHNDQSKALHFRVIANTGGGFFSNEWIALDNVPTRIVGTTSAIFLLFGWWLRLPLFYVDKLLLPRLQTSMDLAG